MPYKRRTEIGGKFSLYFGFFMVALYIGVAGYVLLSPEIRLPSTYKYLFAFILVCYGILRGFRHWKKYKTESQDDSYI